MDAAHGEVPSRSTLERIGKRAGQRMRDALPLVVVVVRTSEAVPEATRSTSIGLDRTGAVTEGACKSVVTMRFKRSGQRWFQHGLSPCLQLRALHLNARLRPCFELLIGTRSVSLAAA